MSTLVRRLIAASIAATDHRLAVQSVVSLEDLTREVFVMREPGSGTRDVAEDALRQHHIALSIAFELGSNDAVKQAVSAGLGLAIISEVTLELELALHRLAVLNVPGLKLNRDLTHVTMTERPHSPALAAFLKSL